MKYKKIMVLISIIICLLFTTSCAFANEITNDTNDFDAQVLKIETDVNNTDLQAGSSLPASTVYFDASASSDGNGSKSTPYKVYKPDRINYGDTVYFADGVYDITDTNSIHSSSVAKTTFIGQSMDKTILRSALTNKFDFTVTDNSYLVLKDLTMTGVHIKNQGNLIADNVMFRDTVGFNPNNSPSLSYSYISKIYDSSYGGVIICDTPSNKRTTLNFTNCYFKNNVASSGGVIATYNTNANIQNCVFYNSTAEKFGGSIYSIKSTLNIVKSSFDMNYAKYGGVIYSNSTDLNIKDSQFNESQAYSFGGVIAAFSSSKLDINNVDFTDYGSLTDAGGAIYSTGGTMKVVDSSFVDGHSEFGGAICNLKTASTISGTEFINNRAKNYGGTIYNMYGTVALTGNTFTNSNASRGGSVFNRLSDSFTLSNNRFTNSADADKQIIFIDGDNVAVTQNGNTYDSSFVLLKYGNVYNVDYYASVPIIKFTPESIDVMPTFYDSRKYGYITPAKDQMQGGNCWAFSGIATLEACLGKATGIAYDFSEENVKNIMSEYSLFDLDTGINNGGNLYMFIAYLAGWFGPTYDVNDVYDDYSAISKLYDSLVHVQNVYILPERQNFFDNAMIKKAVYEYGAVSIGIDLSQNQGHAVTIVGWDDEYASTDFLGNKAVGAWIIKNSWGTDWGYNGFDYLSYQQPISFGYTFIFNDEKQYTNIYQYDFEGKSGYHTINGNEAYLKNKFTAKNNEILSAFSTYFDAPSNFTVSVYQNGKLITTQSGYSEMGYYTISLDKEVSLKKGDSFEISVKYSNEGNKVYIPICTAKEINKISFKQGISFYSSDGKNWVDLYTYQSLKGVACIKAFTRSNDLAKVSISQDSSSSDKFSNIDVGALVNIPINLPEYYEVDGVKYSMDGLLTFNVNGQYYFATVEKGKASLNIAFDKEGTYNVIAQFNSSRAVSNPVSFNIKVVKNAQSNIVIDAKDVSLFYGNSQKFLATLTNDGKPVSGSYLTVSVNGKDYTLKTDAKGQVTLDLNLPVGVYYVTTKYSDTKIVSSKFAVLSTITVGDVTQEYGDSEISASFLNIDGNALSDVNVTFDVELYGINANFNEKYNAITNLAGMASSKINLPVSKYLVSVVNPVTGEKKQFILDVMPIDTSCSVSITQSGSATIFNVIIDTNASITKIIRFEDENPYVNFLIGGNVIKAKANFTHINDANKLILVSSLGLNLAKGDYEVSAVFSGDENFKVSSDTRTFSVTDNPYRLSSSDYLGYYGSSGTIAKLTNNGNPVKGEVVYATIGNKTYNATTDDDGNAFFRPDLEVGDYMVLFNYKGQSLMKYIFVKSTIGMDDLSGQYMDSKVGATFTYYEYTDIKLLKNSKVQFIVNGKVYNTTTDSNGYASVDVDLPVGTHTVTAVNLNNGERKQSKITIFKSTPSISLTKSKRGDSVFLTASLKQTSAIGNVVFTMGENKYVSSVKDGQAILALIVLDEGSYEVYANYIGDSSFNNILSPTLKFDYEHTNYTLTAPKISKYYGGSEKFEVTLKNFNKPVANEVVSVTIGDVVYNLTTNSNGVASSNIKLNPGTYSVLCSYDDRTVLSEITIKSTVTVLSSTVDVSTSKLNAEFRDASGNLIKNKEVTFKIGSTEYKKTTDAFGTATLDPSLNKGEYKVAAINPVTDETKYSTLIITKSVPTLTLSVVKQNGVNVLKAVLPKTATGVVDFVFDNGDMFELDLVGGQCVLDGINPGEHTVTATYNGDDAYGSVSKSIKFTVYRIASELTASGVTTTYGVSKKIVVTLKDASGNPLTGRTVTLKLNNKLYSTIVASDGEAEFTVPSSLAPKTYTATVSFDGDSSILAKSKSITVKVNKATPKLTAAKKTFKVKDKTKKYIVTLKTNKNKVYKNQKITIKVNGKTYTAKTNSKGQATFKLNKLTKKGTFKATVKYSGNSKFKAVTKKNIKIIVK